MRTEEIIQAYVQDVVRRVPARQRDDIGLELRGLLAEMLADRAGEGAPTEAQLLALLRDFGSPAELAARYQPPGPVIIPAENTRAFVLTALVGVALQWALTLPAVFQRPEALGAWWMSWGLGSLWWPGFLVMASMASLGLRRLGLFKPVWRPHTVDPDRVHRGALGFGLFASVAGVALMLSLPWMTERLPGALPQVLAFDADFLRQRAWPVLLLWFGSIGLLAVVWLRERWSPALRSADIGFSLAFIALFVWWVGAGPMFQAPATNDGARICLGLLALVMGVDVGLKLMRRARRISV